LCRLWFHVGAAGERSVATPKRTFSLALWFLAFVLTFATDPAFGNSFEWPTLGFTQIVTNTFVLPTSITHAGDGSQRIFVEEQIGRIWIIQSNTVPAQPFLDITNRVLSAGFEQGLLGLAFPPGYSTNGHFYVDYTRQTDGAVVVSRFQLSTNSNVADTNSEQIVMAIPKSFNNHNGGQIAFGPDGYLYIGVGDGGSEGDPQNIGQNTGTLLGKLLRIDVESGASPYAVPANNPFVGNTNYAPEIWALGLRNPWRFSFDRITGDLYIGDVGQGQFEEIDFQPDGSAGGQNYGWRIMEGPTNYIVPPGFTNFSALALPVAWYDHHTGGIGAAAVIGGYVYRGPSQPRMDGVYFYGDFELGWLWGLKQTGTNWQSLALISPAFMSPHFLISTFGEDEQGGIYLAEHNTGIIYQIQDTHQVWTPTFSPANGTLNSNVVMVTCFTTNAEIHYTTNGVDPTLSDPIVATGGFIQVNTGITNKARAYRADLNPSSIGSAIYTNKVATPVLSPPGGAVTNGTIVRMSTITPGATIYYTTNGTTPTTNSLVYSSPIVLQSSTSLKVIGIASGYIASALTNGSYSIPQTAAPVFSPLSGQVLYGAQVSISCATAGSTIYCTLDGSAPSINSPIYIAPITINKDTTLTAFADAPGYANSLVRTNTYVLPQAPPPIFSPHGGPLTNGAMISITAILSNSVIRYTVDGTSPTTNSPVYSGPLTFNNQITLSARVFRVDLDPSLPTTTLYGLQDFELTVVTTIAGEIIAGYTNAIGQMAQFSNPQAICMNNPSNLLVADSGNNVVRGISLSGNVITIAGTGVGGYQLGQATNAQFLNPAGVCVDTGGNIFVADGDSCSSILKIDTNSNVTFFANMNRCGNLPALGDMVTDSVGNIYAGSWAAIVAVSKTGGVRTLAGSGNSGYNGWTAHVGPSVDAATNVYAATEYKIWRISPGGVVDLYAGSSVGYSDGPRTNAYFQGPQDVAIDSATNIFVTDLTSIRKIRPDGWVSTMAGTGTPGYQNGRGSIAQFNGAAGLCVDTNGNVYVADSGNNCIRKISPDTAGIGIADDWQIAHFGHVGIDPNADPDHDGMSNYQEFWAGTDPLDPKSVLVINSVSVVTNGLTQISWQSVPGKSYAVKYSADFSTWNTLTNPVQGSSTNLSVVDPTPVAQVPQRFYRVFVNF
jgi:glucose/arabinose dehydrogenase